MLSLEEEAEDIQQIVRDVLAGKYPPTFENIRYWPDYPCEVSLEDLREPPWEYLEPNNPKFTVGQRVAAFEYGPLRVHRTGRSLFGNFYRLTLDLTGDYEVSPDYYYLDLGEAVLQS